MAKKCVQINYFGRVQGVGFRYRTESIAQNYSLKGWVMNLPDGSVEIIAGAEEEKLKMFMLELEAHLQSYIQDKTVLWHNSCPKLKKFHIRY
ncbi:MAG: acylphosphatase [Candidatus Omnitrophota bacterium]|nr:MAG: acylphosphatase [Candidatus Omnitrophota bacterium]